PHPDRDEGARLLEAAGSTHAPDAIEALIDGVLAAPAEIGTGWHRLVADPMPQQLADCLEALRAAKAAGYHDGLSRDDFARQARSERLARAPTSIRGNMCHHGVSASPGLPALPGRPASRSCCATAQRCLSMDGTHCRRPPRL